MEVREDIIIVEEEINGEAAAEAAVEKAIHGIQAKRVLHLEVEINGVMAGEQALVQDLVVVEEVTQDQAKAHVLQNVQETILLVVALVIVLDQAAEVEEIQEVGIMVVAMVGHHGIPAAGTEAQDLIQEAAAVVVLLGILVVQEAVANVHMFVLVDTHQVGAHHRALMDPAVAVEVAEAVKAKADHHGILEVAMEAEAQAHVLQSVVVIILLVIAQFIVLDQVAEAEEIRVEAVVHHPGILEVEVDQALVLQNVVVIILQVAVQVIVLVQAVEVVEIQAMVNHLGIVVVAIAIHHGILVVEAQTQTQTAEEAIMDNLGIVVEIADHHGITEAVTITKTVTATQTEMATMDHLGIMIILTIITTTIQEIPI